MGQCISQIPAVSVDDKFDSNGSKHVPDSARTLGSTETFSFVHKTDDVSSVSLRVFRSRRNRFSGSLGKRESTKKDVVPTTTQTKFRLRERRFDGSFEAERKDAVEQRIGQSIEDGIREFKARPDLYYAMFFPFKMRELPVHEQEYVLLRREGMDGFRPYRVSPKGKVTLFTHEYKPLKPFSQDVLPERFHDKFTDSVLSTYKGRKLHSEKHLPLLPGRGMGCCDQPDIQLFGDNINPSAVNQGQIKNCWLLSGIAALAEHDGAIENLFRKTKNFGGINIPKKYTVTLYDLTTWKEVDVVVDERLCARADGSRRLLGAKPTRDGELWVSYLEKAVAAHCGGWDKIDGGHCTHAWSLLTGAKQQFIVKKKKGTEKFVCTAWCNTEMAEHGNASREGHKGLSKAPWPRADKGDKSSTMDELGSNQLFSKMCEWNGANFLLGASSEQRTDQVSTNRVVDKQSDTVVKCLSNVAGTGMDMIRIRNPFGNGQSEKGKFRQGGPGWRQYPEIQRELRQVSAATDDELFWLSKEEFFRCYDTVCVGATDMKQFSKKNKRRSFF